MKEKYYSYGPWEYRHVCKSCGHAVKQPKQTLPCSVCGGDFGQKNSMRKVYLEPEPEAEIVEVETELDRTFLDALKQMFGLQAKRRTVVRKEKRRGKRRWRWQTHAEIEDESGIVRHDEFFN